MLIWFDKEIMISLSVVSELKNDEGTHAHPVESTRSNSDQYLLLMDGMVQAWVCQKLLNVTF